MLCAYIFHLRCRNVNFMEKRMAPTRKHTSKGFGGLIFDALLVNATPFWYAMFVWIWIRILDVCWLHFATFVACSVISLMFIFGVCFLYKLFIKYALRVPPAVTRLTVYRRLRVRGQGGPSSRFKKLRHLE